MVKSTNFFPQSIEDLGNYLGDAFYPQGGFDAEKIKIVAQWILQRQIDDQEHALLMEKFYIRVTENNG